MEQKCTTCRFFDIEWREKLADYDDEGNALYTPGECRIRAPQSNAQELMGALECIAEAACNLRGLPYKKTNPDSYIHCWPTVEPCDWCGEWQAKPSEVAEQTSGNNTRGRAAQAYQEAVRVGMLARMSGIIESDIAELFEKMPTDAERKVAIAAYVRALMEKKLVGAAGS